MSLNIFIVSVLSVKCVATTLFADVKDDKTTTTEAPVHYPRDGFWQPVAGTKTVIRVVALGLTRDRDDNIICRLRLPDSREFTLEAVVKPLSLYERNNYTALSILCYLPPKPTVALNPDDVIGGTLAIEPKETKESSHSNSLLVLDTRMKVQFATQRTFHTCIQPLIQMENLEEDQEDWLIEWFELNRILGVTHFMMYGQSINQKTLRIINHYRTHDNIVTLMNWNIPHFNYEIPHFGQVAALYDCLYRSMSSADWLLMIDVDELVIPRRVRTLHELLDQLTTMFKRTEQPASFVFKNAFFYVEWGDDPVAPGPQLTARKTLRAKPHAHGIRSKYIAQTQDCVTLGIHYAWQLLPGVKEKFVPEEFALVHHYRDYESSRSATFKATVDRTVHKYWPELVDRVKKEKRMIEEYRHVVYPGESVIIKNNQMKLIPPISAKYAGSTEKIKDITESGDIEYPGEEDGITITIFKSPSTNTTVNDTTLVSTNSSTTKMIYAQFPRL